MHVHFELHSFRLEAPLPWQRTGQTAPAAFTPCIIRLYPFLPVSRHQNFYHALLCCSAHQHRLTERNRQCGTGACCMQAFQWQQSAALLSGRQASENVQGCSTSPTPTNAGTRKITSMQKHVHACTGDRDTAK